jgi:HD-GYP domain-containing protein (c-di-GMP phosphodiesterase class II)
MKDRQQRQLQNFIRLITTAAANVALYNEEHPQVLSLCQQALGELRLLFDRKQNLTLKVINNELIANDTQIAHNLAIEHLLSALCSLGISFIEMTPGASSEELLRLAITLSKQGRNRKPHKTEHISYGRVAIRHNGGQSSAAAPYGNSLAEVASGNMDRIAGIYADTASHKQIDVSGLAEIVGDFIGAFEHHSNALLAMAPLRSMDEYAYVHSTNICLLNLAQAKLLGLEGAILNDIGIAAMLHDVGKMFISPEILGKQGKLDADEWAQMQRHPELGAEYLLSCPGIPRLAVVNAYEHHIGYDGKGYPQTPHNWGLNTCSYMTAIADVYDALRTRRTYKEPLSFAQIKTIMLDSAGKSLHPNLTCSFLDALELMEQEAQDALDARS